MSSLAFRGFFVFRRFPPGRTGHHQPDLLHFRLSAIHDTDDPADDEPIRMIWSGQEARQESFIRGLLLARRLSAERAAHFGLINEVVPHDSVMDVAMERAGELASMAPLAVRAIKELAVRGQYMPLNEGLRFEQVIQDRLRSTEDGKEGPRAFAEKRAPNYKGR